MACKNYLVNWIILFGGWRHIFFLVPLLTILGETAFIMLLLLILIHPITTVHSLLHHAFNPPARVMSRHINNFHVTLTYTTAASSSVIRKARSGDDIELIETMQPRQLVSLGMKRFVESKIEDSIELFDRADSSVPNGSLTPYLWQRGISLYYTDRFQEGSNQVSCVSSNF